MSTNHFSTDLPEAQYWWAHHQHSIELPINQQILSSTQQNHNPIWPNSQLYRHPPTTSTTTTTMFCTENAAFTFNLNHHDEDEEEADENDGEKEEEQYQEDEILLKESMFEKPLTPSDVGKLNRLVIPKQHAERYFPLSNSDSVEKGLLLSFEDESGKAWKFRYSYWNSSQSYVLTKGWSRFVKEKKLDAGDVVLFERHQHDGDRFFIGWRRKGTPPATQQVFQDNGVAQPVTVVGGGGWTPVLYTGHPYPPHGSHLPYQTDYVHAGSNVNNQISSSSSGHPKRRLRLFGVNLECQPDHDHSEPSTSDNNSSSMSSHDPLQHHHYSISNTYQHHNHMQQQEDDMNFSRDVKQSQLRFRHG